VKRSKETVTSPVAVTVKCPTSWPTRCVPSAPVVTGVKVLAVVAAPFVPWKDWTTGDEWRMIAPRA
jgi:hypothetical protein